MDDRPGFKKVRRVAHTPKNASSRKRRKTEGNGISFSFANEFRPPPMDTTDMIASPSSAANIKPPTFIVASGTVVNNYQIEPQAGPSSSVYIKDWGNGTADVKPILRIKLGGETQLRKLRGTSKPDRFNEERLFTQCYRDAHLAAKKLKEEPGTKRKGSQGMGGKKSEKSSAVLANELVKKLHVEDWTLDSPVPQVLAEMYAKNFNLNTKDESNNPPPRILIRPDWTVMDWDEFLSVPEHLRLVPPVTSFKNAPLRDIWDEIAVPGLAIELRNVFMPGEYYWVATIVYFAGYRALVRFEDFGDAGSPHLAWISFCSNVPKPLGWCQKNGKCLKPGPVIPRRKLTPSELESKLAEFQTRRSIPDNHAQRLEAEFNVVRKHWNVSLPVEALDPSLLNQNRLARIAAIAGDRIHLLFSKEDEDDEEFFSGGFWYHYKSELVHHLMWSHTVGVKIVGGHPGDFSFKLPADNFPSWPSDKIAIKKGMKFEARHPTEVHKLVAAQIVDVYDHGYFLAETQEKDSFTRYRALYSIRSPYVLPIGFGERHGVEIDHRPGFYEDAQNLALAVDLIPPRPNHDFKVGYKMEAFDEQDTGYLGPSTVQKVAGHLLLMHFDGWKKSVDDNYQWLDAESTNLCPAGYAQMCRFFFQGPVMPPST